MSGSATFLPLFVFYQYYFEEVALIPVYVYCTILATS